MRAHRLLAAGLLALATAACQLPYPQSARLKVPPRPERARPLLWRVDGGARPSYLFGTIHVRVPLDQTLGPAGLARLDAARRLIVEVDVSDPDAIRLLARRMLESGRLPKDVRLRALLSPASWRTLVALHAPTTPAGALDGMEPWLASLLTIARLETRRSARAADTAALPMDMALTARAKGRSLPVVGLETPNEQIDALAALARPEAARLLEETLQNVDSASDELDRLVQAYSAADNATALAGVIEQMELESPAAARILFHQRNRRWMSRLVPALRAGGAFVAVGAGHLVGDRGLLALLEARGFTVTRDDGGATAP